MHALAAGDLAGARRSSALPLSEYFGRVENRGIWIRRSKQVNTDPASEPWITGIVLDLQRQQTVGRAGYHGPPDERGMVEVGYEIDPEFRRKGYAKAALEILLDRAWRNPEVKVVRASIASNNLLRPYGFSKVGEEIDPEDGLEYQFELQLHP